MEHMVMLITGTRKGIGRYLAEYYASKGHTVVGCSREEVDWETDNYIHLCADVTSEPSVKHVMRFIKKEFGHLDVAINNAGIASMNHILLTPLETVERIMKTNYEGTFLVSREAAKLMKSNHFGRIVNMGTVATPMQIEGEMAYASSKAAVVSLTQIMAREVAKLGITVNLVGPPPIHTDLIRSVEHDKINKIVDGLAIKRLGKFEDVANVIDFFIKPESDYITGQCIYLGGVS